MARKLISIRSVALFFLAAATLWVASAQTAKHTPQWDDQASKELMLALHHNRRCGERRRLRRSEAIVHWRQCFGYL